MLERVRRWQRRHWRERSKAERVELQTLLTWHVSIWTFSLGWLMLPLVGGLDRRPAPLALGGLMVAVSLLQCAAAGRLLRPALDHYLGRAELPARALRPAVCLFGLALAPTLALAAVDGAEPAGIRLAVAAALLPLALPYALLVPIRVFLRRSAVLVALIAAAFAAVRPSGLGVLAAGAFVVFAAAFALIATRCGAWTLSVLWEAERAREIEARLAVAEERLRFGRDLHDVLGRNLSVISLKSELAVQLARRGRPEAVEQMIEVQRIAQESQREVRAVVRGYREADLEAELAGARGVLTAAGIECEVRAETTGLPARVQSALGWVVREAATNVLRHGDASRCTVGLGMREGHVVLTVENDGVAGPGGTAAGRAADVGGDGPGDGGRGDGSGEGSGGGSGDGSGEGSGGGSGYGPGERSGGGSGEGSGDGPGEGSGGGSGYGPGERSGGGSGEGPGDGPGEGPSEGSGYGPGERSGGGSVDGTSGGSGGGSGLAGLRERLAAVDGSLEAGAVGEGRFRVVARVPLSGGEVPLARKKVTDVSS
ncbi:histidine kinase [Streptomyces sp. NPDC096012]|uniref:sensor histidine kinase n=1 Tax=Streptomyces sp. NPDC096012 TaxID=3155684 RepID=UPI003369F604